MRLLRAACGHLVHRALVRYRQARYRVGNRDEEDAEPDRLLDDLLDVLADPAIPDDQAGRITYACNLGYASAGMDRAVVLAARHPAGGENLLDRQLRVDRGSVLRSLMEGPT